MSWINRMGPALKLLISAAVALLLYWITKELVNGFLWHVMLSWDAFCLCFLVLTWITFCTTRPQQIRNEARIQNAGKVAVFAIALLATVAALAAVLLLLLDRSKSYSQVSGALVAAFGGLLLSWTLVHSIFAVRYAHIYYADHKEDSGRKAGGLDFPGEMHPDFLDFAYFSFIIGMTFQVSDVAISSRSLRRLALLHSLIAFGFNTVIVALTINVIAGLSH